MCGSSGSDAGKDRARARAQEAVGDTRELLQRTRRAVRNLKKGAVPIEDSERGRKAAEAALRRSLAASTARRDFFEPGAFVAMPSLAMSVLNAQKVPGAPQPAAKAAP